MTSLATRLRAFAGLVAIAAALLVALPAQAQSPYNMTLNIDGLANGNSGNYTNLVSYAWGPDNSPISRGVAPELTFIVPADTSSVTLIEAAASGHVFPTAELQHLLNGTATVDILMTNVRVSSVRVAGDQFPSPTDSYVIGPVQIVTLRFTDVTYTFQPVTPTGQKAGPPVTYSVRF
jgi:type VI protein secretion system component Hcp